MPSASFTDHAVRDVPPRELVYVTDNDRDAEVLRQQTSATVEIRRPLLEEVLAATDEIYITRVLRGPNVRNVWDVPDVSDVRELFVVRT